MWNEAVSKKLINNSEHKLYSYSIRNEAEAEQQEKERVKDVMEVLCGFVRTAGQISEEKEKSERKQLYAAPNPGILAIKRKILRKFTLDIGKFYPREKIKLFGANLQDIKLFGFPERENLKGADLRRAILVGTTLGKTDLESANLEGADFQGADLRETCLLGGLKSDKFQESKVPRSKLSTDKMVG